MMAELPFLSEFLQSGFNRLNCKYFSAFFWNVLKFSSGTAQQWMTDFNPPTAMVHHPNLLKQLPLKQKKNTIF